MTARTSISSGRSALLEPNPTFEFLGERKAVSVSDGPTSIKEVQARAADATCKIFKGRGKGDTQRHKVLIGQDTR